MSIQHVKAYLAELDRRHAAQVGPVMAAASSGALARSDHVQAGAAPATPEIASLERQLAAAKHHAQMTARAKPGELIEQIETDRSGRRISRFYGDSEGCWGAFKHAHRVVTGIGRR